ncbi:hypothetical protein N4T77_16525 [Clostridium sp. CX1]|uniref:hypothetical protein n=1 Tax=Clostridium sp. CX1 TaxID=2978346 RepID=UPI0021C00D5C|nr:hypothetical protein [Clostridium sp. CX1]MCT8978199.1 hypothetical protein [Clostridium sp. CX1]
MVKPSIFSKDYEKQMKRRKRRIVFIGCLSIIIIVFAVMSVKGIFEEVRKDMTKNLTTTDKKDVKTIDPKNSEKEEPKKTETKENGKDKKPEGYDIQLSDGKTITAVYEVKDNNKLFKEIAPAENNVSYSMSPSKQRMVVFDNKVQSIILIDVNGNKQDVANPQYTSTSGTVISKDSQLSSQPDYIWCSSPKFIDEDNIAYISQLPWLGKTTKYIWIENLKDKSHILVQGIEGEDITLGDLTDKGVTVTSDGRTVFLDASGNISE